MTTSGLYGIMEVDRLKRQIKEIREKTAEFVSPGFSYYEQELIRRVIKAVISQMINKTDISIAKDIIDKTGWLDG